MKCGQTRDKKKMKLWKPKSLPMDGKIMILAHGLTLSRWQHPRQQEKNTCTRTTENYPPIQPREATASYTQPKDNQNSAVKVQTLTYTNYSFQHILACICIIYLASVNHKVDQQTDQAQPLQLHRYHQVMPTLLSPGIDVFYIYSMPTKTAKLRHALQLCQKLPKHNSCFYVQN